MTTTQRPRRFTPARIAMFIVVCVLFAFVATALHWQHDAVHTVIAGALGSFTFRALFGTRNEG